MKTINILDPDALSADDSIKLHEVARYIYKAKKTTMLTGAGISCNAGIPDFRSDDGLYNIVKAKYPSSFIKGQDLFDISLFRSNETLLIFCTFMEGLYKYSLQAKATETHKFIKTLKEKNKLLRCYTQNIDSIEKSLDLNCGIDSAHFNEIELGLARTFRDNWKDLDVVQLHGNLHKLSCTQCLTHYEWTAESQTKLREGENPECENCYLKFQERLYAGKRMTGNIGILRPDIVLYGENHPQSEILARGLNIDMGMKCDLVLIMGTLLKVDGVKKLVRSVCKNVRERGGKVVFVNKSPVAKQFASLVDYEVLCDCDDFIRALRHEIPDLFLTQEQLDSKKLQGKQSPSKPYDHIKNEQPEGVKLETTTARVKIENPTNRVKLEKSKHHAIKSEAGPGVGLGNARDTVLTPPNTPTKKRALASERKRPTLKACRNKKAKVEPHFPSPCPSFTESIKIESESDVATDCDDFDGSTENKENMDGRVAKQENAVCEAMRVGA
ncbi:DHS-like NAD/FAD-binding domain-containing protein [Metschnikowia bicuspidata var. bicuspidata NRRL YB-4993]|uniref:DHS-like NAD/FAD-binding domain-containing protein n=1 Tax=Metschnikowia bicuspidata var. bicuspidata NRRL YB-4993 TaxID=869754 RepID=A0A1A0H2A0_9ASCO|nr:DHS-like NAD/FAD-binding domain-containing protein [Metschnikowia bicuspidata var. bicuspidata NRRL YB-4993]OBA18052.1 DHS-like NAD/FAD-binding domain-containing protein [Metschnikowia bicuspidata var. bicuspidata NRRL YB-4993]